MHFILWVFCHVVCSTCMTCSLLCNCFDVSGTFQLVSVYHTLFALQAMSSKAASNHLNNFLKQLITVLTPPESNMWGSFYLEVKVVKTGDG